MFSRKAAMKIGGPGLVLSNHNLRPVGGHRATILLGPSTGTCPLVVREKMDAEKSTGLSPGQD